MTMNQQINKELKITHLKLALFILITCYWNMNMNTVDITLFFVYCRMNWKYFDDFCLFELE